MRNKAWSCSLWENKRKEWKKNLGQTKHRDGSADNSNLNDGNSNFYDNFSFKNDQNSLHIMIILASDTMVIFFFFYFGLKDDDNSYLYDNLSLEAQGVETFPLLKQRDGCLCSET